MRRRVTDAELRAWVIEELDSIEHEMNVPMNTGLIARSLITRLRSTVAAFPDVWTYA